MGLDLFREEDRAAIAAALETDPTFREALATFMATTAAITRANDGVAPVMVLPQHAPTPDYHMTEAADGAEPEPVEVCSCEEALALRDDVRGLYAALRETERTRDLANEALLSLNARMVQNAKNHDELRRQWAARIEQLEAELVHCRAKCRVGDAELVAMREQVIAERRRP